MWISAYSMCASMNQEFRYLIEDFCKRCGIGNPGRILDGGALVVNEVSFSLIYSGHLNPAAVLIYCDFGEIPPGSGARLYLDLLEAHAGLADGSAFSVSDDTGRVVLTDSYPLEKAYSPDQLRETLIRLAAKAIAWRKSCMPGERNPSGPVSSAALLQHGAGNIAPARNTTMSAQFVSLIHDFCAFAKMPCPDYVLRGGSIAVDGVRFALTSKQLQERSSLLVRCDFGELPDERLVDACKALLTANWHIYDGTGSMFSVYPANAHVLFDKSYPLDTLTARALPSLLTNLAAQVHEWRERRFLDPLPKVRKGLPRWAARQWAASNFQ